MKPILYNRQEINTYKDILKQVDFSEASKKENRKEMAYKIQDDQFKHLIEEVKPSVLYYH